MKKFVIALMLLCIPSVVIATDHYIRAPADCAYNGDGTTWACAAGNGQSGAFNGIPATLSRGDTYYLSDGSYPGYDFNDAASGTTYTYIKKATAADHGTASGWEGSYGNGQAIFTDEVKFSTNYWEFNGNIPWDGWQSTTASFGFAVIPHTAARCIYGSNVSHIIIKSVYADLNSSAYSGSSDMDVIQFTPSSYITISNAYVTNDNDGITFWANTGHYGHWLTEYVYFFRKAGDVGLHGDAYVNQTTAVTSVDEIIRYCHFNWAGQQLFFENVPSDGVEIYGNVFYNDQSEATGEAQVNFKDSRISNFKFYNNTLYKIMYPFRQNSNTIKGFWINNILFSCGSAPSFGAISNSYNYYDESGPNINEATKQEGRNPFVSAAANNFRLSGATASGNNTIGEKYNKDLNGITRGGDGTWDRGAYEYVGSTGPSTPKNIKIIEQ